MHGNRTLRTGLPARIRCLRERSAMIGSFGGSRGAYLIALMRHPGGVAATSCAEAAKSARRTVDLAYMLRDVCWFFLTFGVTMNRSRKECERKSII